MYFRLFDGPGHTQDIEEQKRRVVEFGRRLSLAKEKFERPFNPFLGEALPQSVLKRAGFTPERWVDAKTPALLKAAIEQSRVLRPFIAGKLGKIDISKNYRHYGSDPEFVSAYLKLHKIVVPFGPQERALTDNVRAYYHRPTDSIHLRPRTHFGQVLLLTITKFSSPGFGGFFGPSLADGVGLYFTNLVLEEQGLGRMKSVELKDQLSCATDLVAVAGLSLVGKAYFENHSDLIRHLTTNLSIGPVRTEELARDLLCKTTLLRTARFASHQVKNMVGVGMTGPGFVRLWMRTESPGVHELQIIGARGSRSSKVMIPAGPVGDQTLAVTYPPPNEPQLAPMTKYRFRVVRTGDGRVMGEGSFETAPAREVDTPPKVVIALMSCHQPFDEHGGILPESDRILRLLPRILRENNVKFVLPCGDQIYADDPGVFSLFNNPYLIRQVVPGKTDIRQCNLDEVRRLYDMRYRTFWSLKPIRDMYANYPCYPTLDDHEIMNSWGTQPEHSAHPYPTILKGALGAYFDYQASSVLPRMPSGSFHYNFSYGNIGVFVMDIRSERFSNNSGNQMFSMNQLNDLRQFLNNNANKKVLFIVSSVPVFFVPEGLADYGGRVKPTTFQDHWSHPKNIPYRDAFLNVLYAHRSKNPNQVVAIVSGDVHIGHASAIHVEGFPQPWLYEFTSSPISVKESWGTKTKVRVAPRLVTTSSSDFVFPCTERGEMCPGRVSRLPGVNGASQNPFVDMNIGLIEVQRQGNISKLKFKLIGAHPTEERPVTYFESGWLG
jgi:alkaline phosphatase D